MILREISIICILTSLSNVLHYKYPLSEYLIYLLLLNNCKIKNFLYTQFEKMIFLWNIMK